MSTLSALHHTRVRAALGPDASPRARPATVTDTAADGVANVRFLDGDTSTLSVADSVRLAATLDRPDLCRLRGEPLVLWSAQHGVLAVATGPTSPPDRLVVQLVSRVEDGSVVELIGGDDQPSWQVFAASGAIPAR